MNNRDDEDFKGNVKDYSYDAMRAMFGITESLTSSNSSNDGGTKVSYTPAEVSALMTINKAKKPEDLGFIYDSANKKYYKKYATGGLANFTGPAWLDGTKSKPEYVLNSDQTRAFFTLVDVLESLRIKAPKTSENSGDNTYDIDINVESIGSDYDVDQLADKIKSLINQDARYRNNNTAGRMR